MPNPENEGYQRLGEGLYHLRAAAGGGGELFWGLDPRNPRKRPKFWADVTSISPNMAIFESPKIDGLGIGPLQALSGVLFRGAGSLSSNLRPSSAKNIARSLNQRVFYTGLAGLRNLSHRDTARRKQHSLLRFRYVS